MKEKLLEFFHSLSNYDYIYFISILVIFIVLILLTLLLRKKITLALFILLLAIVDISVGPTFGFSYFHKFLYKNSITITKSKKLQFVESVVIEGNLKNESKFDFKECKVTAVISKDKHNKFKNIVLKFKPIKKETITLKDIPKGADATFKFLIEPFVYKKDFLVSVDGSCK